MNIGIILSGGSGQRFGADLPKQYLPLRGHQVISYNIEAFRQSSKTDAILVVADENHLKWITETYDILGVQGGETRNESLYCALRAVEERFPPCQKVFINEAARPFVTAALVDHYLALLDDYDAVISAREVTDSLGKEGQHITLRQEYYLIQAPEAFRFQVLLDNFSATSAITATMQQLPAEARVYRHFDFRHNLKITYPEDLAMAEALMGYLEDHT